MNKPLITIITSTLNSGKTLIDTINSVVTQTYKNIEFIILDGCSNDNTVEIIKSSEKLFSDNKIKYIWMSEQDKGIYDAWNKALKMASGDWVSFIGSDDYFKNNTVIENSINHLNFCDTKGYNYVYGKIEHVSCEGELIEVTGKDWNHLSKRFTFTMNLPFTGCFLSNRLFEKHGDFNDTFKIAGDYEFLLRELKLSNNKAFFVDEVFSVMREGGVSASLNNRMTIVKENYKARKLNGLNGFSKELFYWEVRVKVIMFITKLFGINTAAKLADFYRKVVLNKDKRWSI